MADDVSTGELARRLDQLLQIVQTLVSRPEYTADHRHAEHRFTEIERDIAAEQAAREAAVREVHERIDKETTKKDTDRRQLLFSGLVPSVLVLASIAVSVLLAIWR
ncbi:MAG: hypothetical protein ACRDPR_04855 [Nocardioidaceae bacterium]